MKEILVAVLVVIAGTASAQVAGGALDELKASMPPGTMIATPATPSFRRVDPPGGFVSMSGADFMAQACGEEDCRVVKPTLLIGNWRAFLSVSEDANASTAKAHGTITIAEGVDPLDSSTIVVSRMNGSKVSYPVATEAGGDSDIIVWDSRNKDHVRLRMDCKANAAVTRMLCTYRLDQESEYGKVPILILYTRVR